MMDGFFEDFIFPSRLQRELALLVENPRHIPRVLCFYGYPGTGKTSFARYLANEVGSDVQYLPMNESKIDRDFVNTLRMSRGTLMHIFEEMHSRPFKYVAVLDEFHNLAPKSQDFFKTRFDSLGDDELVIVCLNNSVTRSIEHLVTKPILSRMHLLNFNISSSEFDDMVDRVASRYPRLSREEIEEYLPDMRRVTREARLRLLYNQAEFMQ